MKAAPRLQPGEIACPVAALSIVDALERQWRHAHTVEKRPQRWRLLPMGMPAVCLEA